MKKFNLVNEIIVIEREALLKAINTNQEFAINYRGEVIYPPFGEKEIFVFKGKATAPKTSTLSLPKPQSVAQILGNNYKVVEDDDRILIKAGGNWQALIALNIPNSDYDDTTGDGISEFADEQLEDMGWHSTEFNIDYRDMVNQLEEKADGIVLCIERDEPYQFSGLGFCSAIDEARPLVYGYCQNIIKEKLAGDPDFAPDNLTDDEEEAARFFECL